MIHAYFDDSGTGDAQGMLCIAGYVAGDLDWTNLAEEWALLTKKHGISYLHTSDFLSGRCEYQHMNLPEARRLEILAEFMMCVRRHVCLIVAVAVDAPAYRRILKEQRKKFSALEFCFYRIINRTVEQAGRWGPGVLPLVMVFDDSNKSGSSLAALQELKKHREEVRVAVAAYTFADDKHFQPLQAADMLACITTREYRKGPDNAWRSEPFSNLLLTEDPSLGIPSVSELWDDTTLTPDTFRVATQRE
jgi:hypothetical protein